MKNLQNSFLQGNVGIGHAIQYFTKKGYIVLNPLNDSQKYDLVVDMEDGLKKIQVKTTYHKSASDTYDVSLRTNSKSKTTPYHFFTKDDADFLFVVTANEEKWIIPSDEITVKRSLSLNNTLDKYKILDTMTRKSREEWIKETGIYTKPIQIDYTITSEEWERKESLRKQKLTAQQFYEEMKGFIESERKKEHAIYVIIVRTYIPGEDMILDSVEHSIKHMEDVYGCSL